MSLNEAEKKLFIRGSASAVMGVVNRVYSWDRLNKTAFFGQDLGQLVDEQRFLQLTEYTKQASSGFKRRGQIVIGKVNGNSFYYANEDRYPLSSDKDSYEFKVVQSLMVWDMLRAACPDLPRAYPISRLPLVPDSLITGVRAHIQDQLAVQEVPFRVFRILSESKLIDDLAVRGTRFTWSPSGLPAKARVEPVTLGEELDSLCATIVAFNLWKFYALNVLKDKKIEEFTKPQLPKGVDRTKQLLERLGFNTEYHKQDLYEGYFGYRLMNKLLIELAKSRGRVTTNDILATPSWK